MVREEVVEFRYEVTRPQGDSAVKTFVGCVNLARDCRELGDRIGRDLMALSEKCTVVPVRFYRSATEGQKLQFAEEAAKDRDLPFANPVGPAGIIDLGRSSRSRRWLIFGCAWFSRRPRRKRSPGRSRSSLEELLTMEDRDHADFDDGWVRPGAYHDY